MLPTTLLVVNLLITSLQGGAPICNNFRDCYDITSSYPWFTCTGDESCRDADLTATSNFVKCTGSYGCYNATINATSSVDCGGSSGCLIADVIAGTYVSCNGEYGCHNGNINAGISVTCRGFRSCYWSDIVAGDYLLCDAYQSCYSLYNSVVGGDLTCSGLESCRVADVTLNSVGASTASLSGYRSGYDIQIVVEDNTGEKTIIATGEESLTSSHIYSGLYNTVNIEFRGDSSALDTYIYCELGSTCTVTCYNIACSNTQFICHSESICSTSYVDTPNVEYKMISLVFSPSV